MTAREPLRAAAGPLALRIALGTMWIAHAWLKALVFSLPGFAAWLDSQGLPAVLAWPVFLMELIGGSMILLGLYGRFASLALIPVMLVATWTHLPNGWLHTNAGGGWEYPLFLVLASVAHAAIGDGRLALVGVRADRSRRASGFSDTGTYCSG